MNANPSSSKCDKAENKPDDNGEDLATSGNAIPDTEQDEIDFSCMGEWTESD